MFWVLVDSWKKGIDGKFAILSAELKDAAKERKDDAKKVLNSVNSSQNILQEQMKEVGKEVLNAVNSLQDNLLGQERNREHFLERLDDCKQCS